MFQGIDLAELTTCAAASWSPTIGDPNLTGWITVAAYLVCALLAFAVLRDSTSESRRFRIFWHLMVWIMAFMAINKQLDLQSLLTATGRCLAYQQGWYNDRRIFQIEFILGLLAATLLVLAAAIFLLRNELRRIGLAVLGLATVAGYVAVRAVGFHHIDMVIGMRFHDIRFNVLFELSGLVLICVNALALLLGPSQRSDVRDN